MNATEIVRAALQRMVDEGATQAQAGARIGIKQASVSDYLNGLPRVPKAPVLVSALEVLGLVATDRHTQQPLILDDAPKPYPEPLVARASALASENAKLKTALRQARRVIDDALKATKP